VGIGNVLSISSQFEKGQMRIGPLRVTSLWLALMGSAMPQARPVRLPDSSDWWSYVRQEEMPTREPHHRVKFQNRAPAVSNFQILGLTLGTDDSQQIRFKFGEAIDVERGDAASGRDQICYVAPSGNSHLIFEFGGEEAVLYLFEGGPKWNGSELCAPSPLVSADVSMTSGLRLGLNPQQVKALLGNPNIGFKKKTTAKGLAQLRGDNPNLSDAEFHKNYDYLDVEVYIEARFTSGKLNYLAVSTTGVY
jgi:hypothetical protein